MTLDNSLSTPPDSGPPESGDFRVQTPVEIVALLRTLLDQQARITLSSADGATLATRLCALEAEHSALGFEVQYRDPQLRALLAADEVSASAYLDRIRLEFEVDGLVLVKGAEGAVLRATMPALLLRFQRRQSFRVRPNTRTPQVRLQDPQTGEALRLRIVDLSVGGLALLLPPSDPAASASAFELAHWPLGSMQSVHVDLDRDTHFPATLRLQHVNSDDAAGARLGFAWATIDPAPARTLQLFIDQTQKIGRLLGKT